MPAILDFKITLYSFFGNVIQLTCTLMWKVNEMLLLLICAYQYSQHNNIVIMCVMCNKTRNRDNETERDEEWTRKGQHTFSYSTYVVRSAIFAVMWTVDSMNGICTGACSPLASAVYKFVACSGHLWWFSPKGHPESIVSHPQST